MTSPARRIGRALAATAAPAASAASGQASGQAPGRATDGASYDRVLDTTLSTQFVPGSNLKGRAAGASWLFTLPSLEIGRAVCVGSASVATLRTLAHVADEVIVVVGSERAAAKTRERVGAAGTATRILLRDGASIALADACADLIVVDEARAPRAPQGRVAATELRRLLSPTGVLFIEPAAATPSGLGDDFEQHRLHVTPGIGEAQTAVPAADASTLSYFQHNRLDRTPFRRERVARLYRRARHLPLLGRVGSRSSILAGRADAGLREGPPEYLRRIAADDCVDIEGWRWGMSAPGVYDSRKVVFMLFPPDQDRAGYVVKLTRHARLNARLDNERRALEQLERSDVVAAGSIPRVAFAGRHRGLTVVGETAVEGEPFARMTTAAPDCPLGHAGLQWILDLGARTATRSRDTGEEIAHAVREVLARFLAIYRVDDAQARFLGEQIELLAACPDSLPVVFQHGDPGTWNTLGTADGEIKFLDWEAAEPRGVPLWDLVYYSRSFVMAAVNVPGRNARLAALIRTMLGDSPWNRMLATEYGRYARALGIDASLIEPLYHTCWVHRAVKEATRLSTARLPEGQYLQLLLAGLELRSSPPMRRMFAGAEGASA